MSILATNRRADRTPFEPSAAGTSTPTRSELSPVAARLGRSASSAAASGLETVRWRHYRDIDTDLPHADWRDSIMALQSAGL